MGWPLRGAPERREFGGIFIYPMGENRVAIGMVVGLDYTDATLSVHDLLQELKTHPKVPQAPATAASGSPGGRRRSRRAAASPSRSSFHMPGAMIVGDGAGFVNVPALKGIHYAMRTGMLAAETAVEAVGPGSTAWAPGALAGYDEAIRGDYVWRDLKRVRNQRPAFKLRLLARRAARRGGAQLVRHVPPSRPRSSSATRTSRSASRRRRTGACEPDGELTFDKLSSVFLCGNKTRDDAPNHIRIRRDGARPRSPRRGCSLCPAHVYEVAGDGEDGLATVEVTPSNCVQCGAITAKGGRLTPPEGGSGPEYSVM